MKSIFAFFLFLTLQASSLCFSQINVGFLIPLSGLGDQSFNDMTYAGLIQSRNKYNFNLIRQQCKGPEEKSRNEAMEKLIAQQAEIIITNGWEFTDTVKKYAKLYPDIRFIIHDFPLSDHPNVISTVFGQHEGAFLAGALAAWASGTGKIGFIGGKDMPVIRAFQTGFKEGALHADRAVKIYEVFLSQKDENTSGFDNPGLAFQKAQSLYSQSVDIIFSVAGLSGNGIIRAAAQHNKYAIGVDADQDYMAKGNVLTSVMKRLDKATIEALRLIIEEKQYSGMFVFGLKEGGISLSPMTYTRHIIKPDILLRLDRLKDQIITGNIRVTNYLQDSL